MENTLYEKEKVRLRKLTPAEFWMEMLDAIDAGYFGFDPYYREIQSAYMKRARAITGAG
jgi:hypothetical protein